MSTALQVRAAITAAAETAGIVLDPQQLRLAGRLVALDVTAGSWRRSSTPRGLYVHGTAGRGKSWLVDAYFDAAPTQLKTRIHFHRFFADLHREIHDHRSERDVVRQAFNALVGRSRLLVFDELHVHDSGDARLLTRLLEHLVRQNVTVVATSNYAPDDLLPNPIWHHIAEPGISLIKDHLDVFHLTGATDYRTMCHTHATGFASGEWTTTGQSRHSHHDVPPVHLSVRGRSFEAIATPPGELVASFAQLCETPLSTIEYLEWAEAFDHWVITDIPLFDDIDREAQQRFINLVDVLVDVDVRVTFHSSHTLSTFVAAATARPDGFRMTSRMQLLRSAGSKSAAGHDAI